ncbi:hypothetical protein LCGC14_0742890 [marine sediment metagenome]|uniref:Uncharacterized protein n=1 Tax=marine sediment metagenome TaxID=412755 RepID=A0A0F9QAD5_9ZZZZ
MFKPTGIPEDLKEMIEELVAYEKLEKLIRKDREWLQELLYIDIPIHDPTDSEETFKIEIEI